MPMSLTCHFKEDANIFNMGIETEYKRTTWILSYHYIKILIVLVSCIDVMVVLDDEEHLF